MVMLGPPCNLSDRHATVGDKLGNDQTMPRDQYCVSAVSYTHLTLPTSDLV